MNHDGAIHKEKMLKGTGYSLCRRMRGTIAGCVAAKSQHRGACTVGKQAIPSTENQQREQSP